MKSKRELYNEGYQLGIKKSLRLLESIADEEQIDESLLGSIARGIKKGLQNRSERDSAKTKADADRIRMQAAKSGKNAALAASEQAQGEVDAATKANDRAQSQQVRYDRNDYVFKPNGEQGAFELDQRRARAKQRNLQRYKEGAAQNLASAKSRKEAADAASAKADTEHAAASEDFKKSEKAYNDLKGVGFRKGLMDTIHAEAQERKIDSIKSDFKKLIDKVNSYDTKYAKENKNKGFWYVVTGADGNTGNGTLANHFTQLGNFIAGKQEKSSK